MTELHQNSVDVVLMCNVLHEIDPLKWVSDTFGQSNAIRYLLKNNGYLMVVEDTEMRIGERAHDQGFLVLNIVNLKRLFAIQNGDDGFKYEQEREGRLIAALIPAEYLSRITSTTLKATLTGVASDASDEIKALRKSGSSSFRDGRKLAFHMQQFANAKLTLEMLGDG